MHSEQVTAALSSEGRQREEVRGAFTDQIKGVIHKLATYFPWRSRRSARGDAIHMYTSLIGALILARAVNDDDFAREILTEARKRTRYCLVPGSMHKARYLSSICDLKSVSLSL